MPSTEHEALLQLFRNRPQLAVALLSALELELPEHSRLELAAGELTQVSPTEYRADLTLLLHQVSRVVFAIVVEVQLGLDPRKRLTWPVYVATLRARHDCPCCVLVVTVDEKVATWAAQPIGLGPGAWLTPYVMGPREVPWVRSVEAARTEPELAVLSALAHARQPEGFETAVAALTAAAALTDEETKLYSDLILAALGPAARRAMEELMLSNYQPKSDLVRSWLAEGKAEGLAEGEAKGLAEGEAKGLAEGILTVLRARGLPCSADQADALRQCTDPAVLARWLERAVTVDSADAIFTE